jgi:murein DD-endopeptidase MepM/ murein hydrolase activator NlpD
MAKTKYVYNKHTLQYEQSVVPLSRKLLTAFGFVSAVLVAAGLLLTVAYTYWPSPREKALLREIDHMKYKYTAINNQVSDMERALNSLQDRDANVNRILFGMDPINDNVWSGGTGGSDRYGVLRTYKNAGLVMSATQEKVDNLSRKLDVQKKSLDTILHLAKTRERRLASTPSIKPVREDKLNRSIQLLSGFGVRVHPVHRIRKMHTGLDFACPKGTYIQATGDGVVTKIEKSGHGYGNSILVDHGYGYTSLYAHLQKIEAKLGQRVKKGQRIGLVGDTGTSTAPHLHYEVRINGKPVNPIDFVMDGLTPVEYQKLVETSNRQSQSFD